MLFSAFERTRRPSDSDMERVLFIKLGFALVATEAWLFGCGSGDDDGSAGPSGAGTSGSGGSGASSSGGSGGATSQCTTDAMLVQTSSESHDHLPLGTPITAAQLNAGAAIEYLLPLEQNHRHTLALSVSDLAALRAGMTVTKTSSSDSGHTHTYAVTCL
jgi:hypothetical protein